MKVKKQVKTLVMVTGGITEVEAAEKILAEGKADLIAAIIAFFSVRISRTS